jgi:hypothetical protein
MAGHSLCEWRWPQLAHRQALASESWAYLWDRCVMCLMEWQRLPWWSALLQVLRPLARVALGAVQVQVAR